ncbi:MerR family transcriptional regulator [Priestia sp. FSL R5-0680]|uniref:MerR family transcriptional regulator n=1 Tax=Priestia sp. FSL R5-0680 TaxID=2921582 RepID=UPI0030F8A12D
MSGSVGKSLEHASNTIVEALVKKLFEMNERRLQRESELLSLHDSITNQLEKDIIKQYENQRFNIPGQKGEFAITGLKDNNLVLTNAEKRVEIPLDKMESVLQPVNRQLEVDKKTVDKEHVNSEKTLSSKDVSQALNVTEATVRRYAQTFEKNGYEFEKNEQGHRRFKDSDVQAFDKTINVSKEKGFTLEQATKEVVEAQKNPEKISEKPRDNVEKEVVFEGIVQPQKNEKNNEERTLKTTDEEPSVGDKVIEKNITEAKGINKEVSEKIEKNVQEHSKSNESQVFMPSQIRAQLEVLQQLKNLSDKEILSSFKEATKQSKIEGKPVPQLYKENVENIVKSRIQSSKELTLDTAIRSQEKNQQVRSELREIESKINQNMGVLYQAKLEQKITPEEYKKLNDNLVQQKEQIQERYSKIDRNEKTINDQLKVDLKQEFPELKTEKLSLSESIQLASAAYTMTNEKTIENLRDFSLENDLKGAITSIDKSTKEIEQEIHEITETTFSR